MQFRGLEARLRQAPVLLTALTSQSKLYCWVALVALLVGVSIFVLDPIFVVICLGSLLALALFTWAAKELSLAFTVFGGFLVLLYAGSRDFAYVGVTIDVVPLFVSEMCLGVTGILLFPKMVSAWSSGTREPWVAPLVIYFVVGAIALFRGLPEYGIGAIRDSALCYYAVAFPLTVLLTPTRRHVKALMIMCCAGWAGAAIVVIYRYVTGSGLDLGINNVVRYGAGTQAVASASSAGAALASFSQNVRRVPRATLLFLGIGQVLIGVFLIQHRTVSVAILVAMIGVTHFCLRDRWPLLLLVLGCALGIVLLPLGLMSGTGTLPPLVEKTFERLETISAPNEEASSRWRLVIWRQAMSYGMSHPLMGAGFGPALVPDSGYPVNDRVDPHNSYIAIFYRLGLPGIIALLLLWIPILRRAHQRCRVEPAARFRIGIALSAHLAVAVFACFNVVLEGPYMGIPFWVTLALLYQTSKPGWGDSKASYGVA